MFGGYGNDPNSQTENIGDDPIKASMYGIKNLKIVADKVCQDPYTFCKIYFWAEQTHTELLRRARAQLAEKISANLAI